MNNKATKKIEIIVKEVKSLFVVLDKSVIEPIIGAENNNTKLLIVIVKV